MPTGQLGVAIGQGQLLHASGLTTGPASYANGTGFTITTGLSTIEAYGVNQAITSASNSVAAVTVYIPLVSKANGVITVKIYVLTPTSTSATAWAELTNATNISGFQFGWWATGY